MYVTFHAIILQAKEKRHRHADWRAKWVLAFDRDLINAKFNMSGRG